MKKNYELDYIDLNFKGYANSVRTTDIELPPPTPLKEKFLNKEDSSSNKNYNQENNKNTTKTDGK